MEKIVMIVALALVSVVTAFAASTATGSLAVSGTVTSSMSVVATPGTALSLDPAGNTSGVAYGTVAVSSNRQSWKIGLSSANSGYLVNGSKKIGYAIQISGTVGGQTVTVGDLTTASMGGSWDAAKFVKSVSGKQLTAVNMNTLIGWAAEDASTTTNWTDGTSYTDTVTITLTAN